MKPSLFLLASLFVTTSAHAAALNPPRETVLSRFLRYVQIDTQSKDDQPVVPSTAKQFTLAKLLAAELTALGAQDVRVSEFAIVYARVPASSPELARVPVLGFLSHMDTSPEVSGANVHPIIHTNYQGGDVVLPADPAQVITVAKNPLLQTLIGYDLITADGTTLLGSDDKAGCAEILTLLDLLRQNPQLPHGPLAIAFTPDEEVNAGIEKFDVAAFGARFAFTVDGKALGEIANETWSARSATIRFHGKNTHPGTAKGIMINSLPAVADFLARIPTEGRPETTEGRVGFIHPYTGTLEVEESTVKALIRDFDVAGLEAKTALLRKLANQTAKKFPAVKVTVEVKDDYRNMKEVLQNHPDLIEAAMEAARRSGLKPKLEAIRGGTDGSHLTFQGLPCPDLFTGGQNFHGKLEYNSRRGLEKTTETLVNLVQVFAERHR